jgi:predicted HTH transcriptional regulator
MIAEGESEELEFKQTLRWDIREGRTNKGLEDVIIKTIAAFANSFGGGTLLIGIADSGEATGLDHDYASLGDADRDRFEIHLRNLVSRQMGESFCAAKLKIGFPEIGDVEICRIDVAPADAPVIIELTDKAGVRQQKFYARSGNSSPEIPLNEVPPYLKQRFG